MVVLSEPNAWFTYYHWLDELRAPDFARTVEIHRKLGYDPVELFLDPAIHAPKLALGARLLKRKLGFRSLMDVISLNAHLVKGSHGRITADPRDGPLFITSESGLVQGESVDALDVKPLVLNHVFAT